MSGVANVTLYHLMPRAGFRWRRNQGSPRILRSGARHGIVQHAIIDVHGGGEVKVRKRDAQKLLVDALAITTDKMHDRECGIRDDEGIVDYLERSAQFSELSQEIPEDVWVELVYQIAHAPNEYERRTPKAQKEGDKDQLTALAFAIDDLVRAAGSHWDWMTLEFYAYPHLMGEAADYEIDDLDDSDTDSSDDDNKSAEDDAAEKDLPKRMEELDIQDADGDVEMTM